MSVVLAVRDQARFLGDQIACLAAQDYRGDWELVVADNGSSDGSARVAREAGRSVPALRVLDASERRGASHARNVGAAAAQGDLIAFCDADNQARPGWLRGMVAAAQSADIVTGRFMVNSLNDPDRAAWVGVPPTHGPMRALQFMPFASGGNSAYWSDVFARLEGFDEDLVAGEDVDISWRAQLHGYRLGFAGEAVMDRRCPARLSALLRQHWRYGRAAGMLVRRYRHIGIAHGLRHEVSLHWRVLRALPQSARKRGGLGYSLGHAAAAGGRSLELLTGRGGGSAAIPAAARPASPS